MLKVPFPSQMSSLVRALAAASAAFFMLFATAAAAQVVEADARVGLFLEPSPTSRMRVITPAVTVSATPVDFLTVSAAYAADIVSGASESVKAGRLFEKTPDIVSAASVVDLRQVATGGVTLRRGHTDVGAAYSYGTENDYKSNAITVTSATDFFQRNTKLEFGFGHGFDSVCDLEGNRLQAPTTRLALDSSKGCFTSDADRRKLAISSDNFQGAWTQSWTPVFATQLVLTGSVQNGFLSNPYRSVVVGPSGEKAQEHHPGNRARGAAAVRLKYFIRPLETSVGLGVRAYRDTWNILGQTYELELERNLFSFLRLQVRGRYYRQTAASFFSDDYSGGEPVDGPRGQYFSGDREVSPLKSLLGGVRVTAAFHGHPGARVGRLFIDCETSVGASLLKTHLDSFTWAGRSPDDTLAMIFGANITATF